MAEYISRDKAREIIENQQKAVCYNGRWGRNAAIDVGKYDELEAVLDSIDAIPAAEVEPVMHARWDYTRKHLWYRDEDGKIDEGRLDFGFHNGPECKICHYSTCIHCNPDWEDEECEIGHYVCSVCGEWSVDGRTSYCPNCGARMGG